MDGASHKDESPPAKRRKADKTENKEDRERGDNELAKLKSNVLHYLESSINSDSNDGGDYSRMVDSILKEEQTKPYSDIIVEINQFLAARKFRRDAFLNALLSKRSLPPLKFLYLLHTSDIIPLRDFIDVLPQKMIDQFVQLLKEEIHSTESIFDGFLFVLVTLQVENPSSRSYVTNILHKLSDPEPNIRKPEALKRLHYILQSVSKMRPEKISKLFFVTRLRHFISIDGPQPQINLLENQVKPILNPGPEDSGKTKESNNEYHKIRTMIFSEFVSALQKSEIVDVITSVARSLQCDWGNFVEFILYLISKVRDFGTSLSDPLHGIAKEAVLNLNTPLLKVAFIISWMVLPPPAYSEWFTVNFCASTSLAITKQQKQFVSSTMASLIRLESSELSKIHRATLKKYPEMKAGMHDYIVVSPNNNNNNTTVSSSIGRTASVDDAIFNARSFLESFRLQGKIPEKLKTSQYFGPVWFKGTFIPALLSIEEDQKHTPNPDFKDIHLFVKALQSHGIISQNDINSWKASQDEQIAKVRSAIRLSKGRDAEKGRKPIDPLKSLLREFIDRARIHNFQDIASLFTEIASRVSDYISEHASQTMSCVNLLLQTFCETTKLLHHNDDNRGEKKGKNTNIQWTGHYVRRILFIPSVRAPMIMRVRELICTMGTTLDDAHITCLSLLLAHLEGVNPSSENTAYVTNLFQTMHLNNNNMAQMGFAAKLCSKFVLAMPIVANYVIVPDSHEDSPDEQTAVESDDPYDYGLLPLIVIKLLLWLKSRYFYGQQVVSICSSHSTLHHHNPSFIDFSTTFTLLNSISLPLSRLVEHKLDKFSIDEFLNTEIRIALCGDFLDSSWKAEYIKTMIREAYSTENSTSLQSILEAFIRVIFGVKKEDNVCGCGKIGSCSGKPAVLAAYGSTVESGKGIEWSLSFLENEFEKAVKTGSESEISSSLSIGLQLLSHIHPSAFATIPSTKNLLYVLSNYLKFLIPFQNSSMTHAAYHSSSLVFVLLARIFGLLSSTREQATLIKDLISRPPFGFFFALNLPIYKKTTLLCNSDENTVSMLYADLEVIHSFMTSLKRGQCPSVSASIQSISTLPAIASQVIFHSTFTLCDPLLSFNQATPQLKDKVTKLDIFLNSICGTLQKYSSLDSISSDKTFEFLANFVDNLLFFLSSSSNFNLRQFQSLNTLSNPPSKRKSMDELVEGLLINLISRLPFLLSVFSHPPKLPFLSSPRSTLFPTPSPSSSFSRYPFLLFLVFTSLSSTTLGKLEGEYWKEIVLETYENCKKAPHQSFLSGSFSEKMETWMKEWIERFGVESGIVTRFLPNFAVISPTLSHLLRKFSVYGETENKNMQKGLSFIDE